MSRWRRLSAGDGHGHPPNGHSPPTAGAALTATVPADVAPARHADVMAEAVEFVTMFHRENPVAGEPDERMAEVRRQIEATGTYEHTEAELTFAARVAWRNSSRCIGRLYWRSLRVRDRREIGDTSGIAAEAVQHLREATNGGRIRPVITIFAPDRPGQPGPRFLSPQLVSYSGYRQDGGQVLGDPRNTTITALARRIGWAGPAERGRFDVLPLVIQGGSGAAPRWFELPTDAVLEVPLSHPDFGWFAELGLRWYAVPVVSDMYLQAGGIRYPACPFNGWYMGTEVGSRDLGDASRYDQLPVIAKRMGLSIANDQNLWKDRAVTELNQAVLHSFQAAGVTVTDHHTESSRFLTHHKIEERQGRTCPATWSWIVPPAASSTTAVFHRYYEDPDVRPNFYRHPDLPEEPICHV
ncbi:MAG TPA: nitric oxide synthase oxygenase [Streptosporangiaceae bacterium]|nr:nitric oxide synthase oxygenase [Streptosporangiaceae bacterium]